MTYFITYSDAMGHPHTIHGIPEGQLKSSILSLRDQGGTDFRAWQSVGLIVGVDTVIVGRAL